jgi:hypothetical protein
VPPEASRRANQNGGSGATRATICDHFGRASSSNFPASDSAVDQSVLVGVACPETLGAQQGKQSVQFARLSSVGVRMWVPA